MSVNLWQFIREKWTWWLYKSDYGWIFMIIQLLIEGFSSKLNLDDSISLRSFSSVNDLSYVFLILCFRLKTLSSHHLFLWSTVRMVSMQTRQLQFPWNPVCFSYISVWSHPWHLYFQVEWRLFSLQLLSETTSLLLSHEVMAEKKGESLNSNNKLLSLIRDLLLPQ